MTEHEIAGWFQLGLWGCFWVVVGALAVKLLQHVLDDPEKRETDENGLTIHDWECILPLIRLKSDARSRDMTSKIHVALSRGEKVDWSLYLLDDGDIVQEVIDEWKETKRQIGKKS